MREEHEEEREVLQSIYEGDTNYCMINETTFQYKYGEEGGSNSFLVEISWGPDYPDVAPTISLDLFYNKHISPSVKQKITAELHDQAKVNLGMSMTFTLFEWLKEAKDELLENHPTEPLVLGVSEITSEVGQISVNDDHGEGKREKKEQLTKAQKRRMWDRQNAAGERSRGYNWVDIVKHLSQTGGSKNDG
ncbi:RWD domain-containing protein 4-like [Homarus americanus]|uniref:RWD domain-containing protein 4-like n=1 Tax=Homarus americanus TaxID=6706 RepID=A0A8J5TLD3_HOMAM|nr:RWD domain-containing protein 4-like [Homarus americanus]KAG7177601.1 RWD domain-containing protein 4-like [Homarus americanus]